MNVHNVYDRRHGWIGSWRTAPLAYEQLTEADVGRTVIYQDHGRAEAGTLTSFRNGCVWARYGTGDTAACAAAEDLCFGVQPLDGDMSRGERRVM